MAKFNEREGNSCHIHLSLRGAGRRASCSGTTTTGARTPLYDSFIAGVLATMRDFTLLYAPNINSYKRFADGSFAPTAIAWGEDNRTCAVRLVGHGAGARMENRVPGGDVNPYLALAAMLAGGLHGIEQGLELEPPLEGNAYTSGRPQVPGTLREARDAFPGSDDRPGGARRRGRRPLHEHGRRRAGRLRRRRHRLGAAPRLRADVTRSSDAPTPSSTRRPASPSPRSPLASVEETDAAIERAHEAFPAWRDVAPGERARLLRPLRRRRRRAHRRAGRARGAQRRAHAGQRPLGGRQRPRRPELLLGRARSGCSAARSRSPAAST